MKQVQKNIAQVFEIFKRRIKALVLADAHLAAEAAARKNAQRHQRGIHMHIGQPMVKTVAERLAQRGIVCQHIQQHAIYSLQDGAGELGAAVPL